MSASSVCVPASAAAPQSPAALSTYDRVAALFASIAADDSLGWTQQAIREALQRAEHSDSTPPAVAEEAAHAPELESQQPVGSPESAVRRSLPSTPFSPLVPRVMVTGRSTRRQRRVVPEPGLTPAEADDENDSPLPACHASDAAQSLPSLPATPLSALTSPLRDATNLHSGGSCPVAHRLSFSAAVSHSSPSPSKQPIEDHSSQLQQSFSRLSLAPASAVTARASLADSDLVIPESDCEVDGPSAHEHSDAEDEEDEVPLQPRNNKHKKKRIILSDSDNEQQDDEVEADSLEHEEDAVEENDAEPDASLPNQPSPVPAMLPRLPAVLDASVRRSLQSALSSSVRASSSSVPAAESSDEEDEEFGRSKPKPAKKKRIVISDDEEEEEEECDDTAEEGEDHGEEDQPSAAECDRELADGVEGVPDAALTGECESDESDGESDSDQDQDDATSSSKSGHSDSDDESSQSTEDEEEDPPSSRQKAPTHPASAAAPALASNQWELESSEDDLPSSAPTPVRKPLLTPKPKPSVRSNPNRSTAKKLAPTSARRRAIDSDEEKQYESDDLNFIASDDDDADDSESETSSSGSDSATNSDDDEAYSDGSDDDFDAARLAKKNRKADAALPCISGRAFARQRVALLASTYAEFNRRIFSDRLPSDLCVQWSKSLLTTAGFCKYSRVHGLKQIDLSIKVCDDSTKMRETLAHEMCHAAVVAIDQLTHAPAHGADFKKWGAKVTRTIPALGTVNRCHSYVIHKPFKYQCQNEWCKQSGRLVFLGRFTADGAKVAERAVTGFARYVKEQYSVTKQRNPATPHKDLMKILSVGWNSDKKTTAGAQALQAAGDSTEAAVSQAQEELESQMASIGFD